MSQTASPNGDGSQIAPFNSLATVEQSAGPGDTIVIIPSPTNAPPLDGGIVLKPRQTLIGDGPSVIERGTGASISGSSGLTALPRISNTTPLQNSGDVITLAEGVTVTNLVIAGAFRGGIYGNNVKQATIVGNDVSGTNTSCSAGLMVQTFFLPTTAPGVGVPLALSAGWAGVMVDASSGTGTLTIEDNYVHDTACGNGIDIRMSGTASYTVLESRNFLTRIQPQSKGGGGLAHAISWQTLDTSQLNVNATGNTQINIGAAQPYVDCEGLFANLAGTSSMTVTIDNNTFAHGLGGFSCNGMEMVTSSGSPTAQMSVTNSSFVDDPGDMFEELNFGSGAVMTLNVDHVLIGPTTLASGNGGPIPGNTGECLIAASTGAGNTTRLRVRNSEITGCNNGVVLRSNVINGNGNPGADELMEADIADSNIHDNHYFNITVGNFTQLNHLALRVENTRLTGAGQSALDFEEKTGAVTHDAKIDFGGGVLGSAGNNCIYGSMSYDALTVGYPAILRNNWWGNATGPAPSKLSASSGGILDYLPPLNSAPVGCQ